MIAFVEGTVEDVRQDRIVVKVGGVGFEVYAPLSTLRALPDIGGEVRLHVHLQVKEDGISLYGFSSPEEKGLFRSLISISGIGPKVALNVLSAISPEGLREAVATEDIELLTKIPGVGPKTARRLLLELRDKLKMGEQGEGGLWTLNNYGASGPEGEAVQALMALGYTYQEARKAVSKAIASGGEAGGDARNGVGNVEALVRQALRAISGAL